MGIKWDALFQNEKKQFEKMTEAEKFMYFLLLQFNSPYGWGKENPECSDCSGAVCMALYAATGCLIRVTADDLYRKIFTLSNPGWNSIQAAFFLAGKDKRHGDMMVKAGTATHVTGLVGDGVILNSQQPGARVRVLRDIAAWYEKEGSLCVIRGLNKNALVELAASGNARYGLDSELNHYFNLF